MLKFRHFVLIWLAGEWYVDCSGAPPATALSSSNSNTDRLKRASTQAGDEERLTGRQPEMHGNGFRKTNWNGMVCKFYRKDETIFQFNVEYAEWSSCLTKVSETNAKRNKAKRARKARKRTAKAYMLVTIVFLRCFFFFSSFLLPLFAFNSLNASRNIFNVSN